MAVVAFIEPPQRDVIEQPARVEDEVDAAALGHPALGAEKRQLNLAKDELGFLVLPNREASG